MFNLRQSLLAGVATCAVVAGRTGKLTARPAVAGAAVCGAAAVVAVADASAVAAAGDDGTSFAAAAGPCEVGRACSAAGAVTGAGAAGCVATITTSSIAGPMPLIAVA